MVASNLISPEVQTVRPYSIGADQRPSVRGKFLWRGDCKLYLRGVTYGPFRAEEDGSEYHTPAIAGHDFERMASAGVNAVRVYTVPPVWLLDLAQQHGLVVMAGLPWQQHVTFLGDPKQEADIEQRVREGVRSMAGHPALLGVTIGNEIPASIVRWHGRKRIERFLHRLYLTAKSADPDILVTYVNFPTTEYLELGFLDFACFNVYLESRENFQAYLARLQNLAGEKPLVMAEIGLDSRRNGTAKQAESLDWQIRAAFSGGAAGAFVFAWTDEWHRGGFDIDDWDFGLVTREREPKPALVAIRAAFDEAPIAPSAGWPSISAVVCSYNGSRTIRQTLDHLVALSYPNYEIVVVSDGSTDGTTEIARGYAGVRVVVTPNRGLSSARNTGMREATGEIVAYIDDDAYPDPHWLHYLGHAFRNSEYAAIGGPNLAPPEDGPIAECVAKSPGGPIHVLVTDDRAEHIPGCNFAVRKSALEAIGGWDATYRAAGDDVDLCWNLEANGYTIGFHPAAVVWHHRRNSILAYWRQQRGYGKAEALLERKWPEKYNAAGHTSWSGRIYKPGALRPIGLISRVYHGVWNSAPFQGLYQPSLPLWQALPQMPEWYFAIAAAGGLCLLGLSWTPLLWLTPLFVIGALFPLVQIAGSVSRTDFSRPSLRLLTAGLFILQPIARLWGRLSLGLTPWRKGPGAVNWTIPFPSSRATWSEVWHSPEDWLEGVRSNLRAADVIATAGGDYDRWDLQIRGGLLAAARLRLAVEEHGAGRQLLRWRIWPRVSPAVMLVAAALCVLAVLAAMDRAWLAAAALAVGCIVVSLRIWLECGRGVGAARDAVGRMGKFS